MEMYYVSELSGRILGIKNSRKGFFSRFIRGSDPSKQKRFHVSIENAIREVKKWNWESRFIRPDGGERYIQGISIPMKADIELTSSGILLDITDKKFDELTTIDREVKILHFAEWSLIPQFMIDKDHRILYWNKALEQLSGITAEKMVGTDHHWQAFYPENRPCLADLLVDDMMDTIPQWYDGIFSNSNHMNGAYTVTSLFPQLRENGRWLYITSIQIRDKNGEILGAVETLEDITELKHTEETLKLSEQRFSDIINFLPDATFVIDRAGKIIAWNRAIEEMTGVTAEFMLGKNEHECGIPFYGERRSFLLDLILSNDDEIRNNYPLVQKKDDKFISEIFIPQLYGGKGAYLWLIASPLYDSKGDVIGAIESLRDVTDHKKTEEALQRKTTDLEAANEELIATEEELRANYEELAAHQQQLREAQEQLVKNEKLAVLGKLSGGVGHELRNPLGSIKNAAYFLNMAIEDPDPDIKETLDIINLEIARSEDIISSLLDFARPKDPVRRQVNLNTVIEESFTRHTMPNNVKVVKNLDCNLPLIFADPNKLLQVFSNLVTNGYQAMPDGGTLIVSSQKGESDQVTVTISDTGMGISDEHMKKLFEPLFTTKTKGIGLGLVVSQGIVKAHGGQINVASTVGKGTIFTVTLPVSGEGV